MILNKESQKLTNREKDVLGILKMPRLSTAWSPRERKDFRDSMLEHGKNWDKAMEKIQTRNKVEVNYYAN